MICFPGYIKSSGNDTDTDVTDARLGFWYSNDGGGTWQAVKDTGTTTQPTWVTGYPLTGSTNLRVDCVCDSNGFFHYFVGDPSHSTNLYHYKYDFTTWTLVNTYTLPGTSYYWRVKLGQNDGIHLFIIANADEEYALIDSSGNISAFTVLTDKSTLLPDDWDIHVDQFDKVHVIEGFSGATDSVNYKTNSSGSWTDENVGFGSFGGSGQRRIVVDTLGIIHIVFIVASPGDFNRLYYAYRDTSWHVTLLENDTLITNRYIYLSISRDLDNNIYLSWKDQINNNLYVMQRTSGVGGTFGTKEVVSNWVTSQANSDANLLDSNYWPRYTPDGGLNYYSTEVPVTGVHGIFHDDDNGYYYWPGFNLSTQFRKINFYHRADALPVNFYKRVIPNNGFVADQYTMLLLHFEGDQASTTFLDSSYFSDISISPFPFVHTSHDVTPHGTNMFITGTNYYIGASSGNFGTGNLTVNNGYLTVAASSDFSYSADFTVEFWVNGSVQDPVAAGLIRGCIFYDHGDSSNSLFRINYTNTDPTHATMFVTLNNATLGNKQTQFNTLLSINSWYHIATVRAGTVIYLFVNGASVAPVISSIGNQFIPQYSADLYVGANALSPGGNPVVGFMDEFRISNIARYTSNFTPESSAASVPVNFYG